MGNHGINKQNRSQRTNYPNMIFEILIEELFTQTYFHDIIKIDGFMSFYNEESV